MACEAEPRSQRQKPHLHPPSPTAVTFTLQLTLDSLRDEDLCPAGAGSDDDDDDDDTTADDDGGNPALTTAATACVIESFFLKNTRFGPV